MFGHIKEPWHPPGLYLCVSMFNRIPIGVSLRRHPSPASACPSTSHRRIRRRCRRRALCRCQRLYPNPNRRGHIERVKLVIPVSFFVFFLTYYGVGPTRPKCCSSRRSVSRVAVDDASHVEYRQLDESKALSTGSALFGVPFGILISG